MNKMSAVLKL